MTTVPALAALRLGLVAACTACPLAHAATEVAADPQRLAEAMRGHAIVLLGEVHDNAGQHALRLAALRRLVEGGARPAIAFEQFDADRQAAIDAARRARPRDADHVIAEGRGAPSWNWSFYRPFVALALEHDLPIVAANLSRDDAMRIASEPASAGDAIPPTILLGQERAVARGHCDLLPAEALPGMARAQVARDRALAAAIAPHASRGVVLLTGNGHARTDIGVPAWLPPVLRARTLSVALLEREGRSDAGEAPFDVVVPTEAEARPDPCEALRERMKRAR
jgi:uncharacterized iron-regulated protein